MKNKKFLSLIIVIILALGTVPYIIGNIARNKITQMANQISQMPGYTLKISKYDQGWFSSHAVIAYGLDQHTLNILEKSVKKDDRGMLTLLKKGLIFDVTIDHGPIILQDGIDFDLLTLSGHLQNTGSNSVKQKAKTTGLINLFATVSYRGASKITLNSPAFTTDHSNFTGMEINISLNSALDHYNARAKINKFSANIAKTTIILKQIDTAFSGSRINKYLWLGKGTVSLGKLSISVPNKPLFSLEGVTSNYTLDKENDTALTMHWQSRLAALVAADVSLKDFQMNLDVNHLDIAAMTDYIKSIQDVYQTTKGTPLTPQQTAARIQAISTRIGEKILKKSPELIINELDFSLGGGVLKSNGMVTFNGQELENIQQLSNPLELNKRLIARANLNFNTKLATAIIAIGFKRRMAARGVDISRISKPRLDKAVNSRTMILLQNFVARGYLKRNGTDYSTRFDMKNGHRTINGKALPVVPGK
ncbi:MAG: YdgA family protein [Alphaproteobacteria bacterium]|nr:YdgA family protein [Alphaproteobacteria bacterium]